MQVVCPVDSFLPWTLFRTSCIPSPAPVQQRIIFNLSYVLNGQADKRHWPIDLIALHSTISNLHTPTSSKTPVKPLSLILHLTNPPTEKLLVQNTVEACKSHYVNALKEADFVKWRNTNKVTSLRKVDLDAGWEGIVQGELESVRLPCHAVGSFSLSLPDSTLPCAPRLLRDCLFLHIGGNCRGMSKSPSV